MSDVPRNVPRLPTAHAIDDICDTQRGTHDASYSGHHAVDSEAPSQANLPIPPPSQFTPPASVIPHAVAAGPIQGPGVSCPSPTTPTTIYAPPVTPLPGPGVMPLPGPGVPPSTSCAGYVPTATPFPLPSTSTEESLSKGPTMSPSDEEETSMTPKRAARAARVKVLRSRKYTNPQKMSPQVGFYAK